MLYLVELWEELGDKYYLISPISDLAVRVPFTEEDRASSVCLNPEGEEEEAGRSGVCSLFDVTVVLGSHMKLEAQPLVLSQVTQSLSLEGSGLVHSFFRLMPSLVQKRR